MKKPKIPVATESQIADRVAVLVRLLGLMKDGAFGQLTQRQLGATIELLETSQELKKLILPIVEP